MRSFSIISLALLLKFNDVHAQAASDECLNCIMKNNPIDGCLFYTLPKHRKICGQLRITEDFFHDNCRDGPDPNFESCANNLTCAKACVRTSQIRYANSCLEGRKDVVRRDYSNLTCADYGRIHFGGNGLPCGREDTEEIKLLLSNLTSLCGCETVYGTCDFGMPSTTTPLFREDELLILYTVPSICGVLIILSIIFCTYFLRRNYLQNRLDRIEEQNAREKADIQSHITGNRLAFIYSRNTETINPYSMRTDTLTISVDDETVLEIPPPLETPTPHEISPVASSPDSGNAKSTEEYDAQYEQPLPYNLSEEDHSSLETTEIVTYANDVHVVNSPASDNPAFKDHMYVNKLKLDLNKDNIHTPQKAPVPAPRFISKITYVQNATHVESSSDEES